MIGLMKTADPIHKQLHVAASKGRSSRLEREGIWACLMFIVIDVKIKCSYRCIVFGLSFSGYSDIISLCE